MTIDIEQPSDRFGVNVVTLKGTSGLPAQAPSEAVAEEAKGAPQSRRTELDKPLPPSINSDADPANKRFLRRRPVLSAVAAVAGLFLLAAGYVYWDYTAHFQSTDDAFIDARKFTVAPKVAGYITDITVTDNQHVAVGDVIARIDQRDYRVVLEQAEAQVAVAAANIQNVDAQIEVQQAQIGANQAQVEQAQAALTYAEQQAVRYKDLAESAAGTVQMAEQTASVLRQDQAALRNAQAALTVAQRQIESLRAQRSAADASLSQAKAQRDQAALNLSYTTITAAQAGRVVNLSGSVGQYAQAGTGISTFVPDEVWVTANYKETQLDEVRPGQPVTIHIDAYPSQAITGRVASVQAGSGTAFSLLPAQNATGNFVKIVQRVPVKIVMSDPPADVALGPGMSVEPSIRVQAAPSLYERLMSLL